MPSVFGVDVRAIAFDSIFAGSNLEDVSLVHRTGGTASGSTGKLSSATATTYTVKGFRDDSSTEFDGPERSGDMVVVLTQDSRGWSPSQVTPSEGDTVTVQGVTGTVRKINQDPAQATWVMDCKR